MNGEKIQDSEDARLRGFQILNLYINISRSILNDLRDICDVS